MKIITPKFLNCCVYDKDNIPYSIEFYKKKKLVSFKKLKKWIQNGKFVTIIQDDDSKIIECMLKEDSLDGIIPVVVKSTHKKYTRGTRFDYGFMNCALKDGYMIFYNRRIK